MRPPPPLPLLRPLVPVRSPSQFPRPPHLPQVPSELLALRHPLPRSIPPDFHQTFMGSSLVRPIPRQPCPLPPQPPPLAIIQKVPPPPVVPEHARPEPRPPQVQPASGDQPLSLHSKQDDTPLLNSEMGSLTLGRGHFGFRPIRRPQMRPQMAWAVPPWTRYPRSWRDSEEPQCNDEQSRVD